MVVIGSTLDGQQAQEAFESVEEEARGGVREDQEAVDEEATCDVDHEAARFPGQASDQEVVCAQGSLGDSGSACAWTPSRAGSPRSDRGASRGAPADRFAAAGEQRPDRGGRSTYRGVGHALRRASENDPG